MVNQDAESSTGLQFDRADFGSGIPAGASCANCSVPIAGVYYETRGQVICEACRHGIEQFLGTSAGPTGLLKALAAGLGAGVIGWIVYYAVLALSGYEFSLIAILVGYLVGRAVHWGSGKRGGAAYQALAVALTYVTIVTTYVPMVISAVRADAARQASAQHATTPPASVPPAGDRQAPVSPDASAQAERSHPLTGAEFARALGMFGLLILALPFLQGFSNVIGIVIIGIGLYQAWKLNRRVRLEIAGPFTVPAAPVA